MQMVHTRTLFKVSDGAALPQIKDLPTLLVMFLSILRHASTKLRNATKHKATNIASIEFENGLT